MVKEQIKQLEEPALRRLKDIGGITGYMRFFFILSGLYLDRCPLLSHSDAIRKVFIQLAHISFTGLPNLIKCAKVAFSVKL